MDFTESVKTCLQKYIDFNGRASRSEYWWFVLLTILLSFIPVIGWILRLVLLLPSLAVQVRRLHDMERSAWWLLLFGSADNHHRRIRANDNVHIPRNTRLQPLWPQPPATAAGN